MKRIAVALGERGYPILLGHGLLGDAAEQLRPLAREDRLIVVSDENVWALWGNAFSAALEKARIKAVPLLVAPGESSKSWEVLAGLVERLLAAGVERGDTILAFGGGVIGDLAGFAAAIVKRGIFYVQIPTSLLAQVDSSVGGKTAINTPCGKNLVGAFHQPSAVLIDPATLDTLPERQLRAGYAEAVKYGLIGEPDFFAWCEKHGPDLLAGDTEARLHAIETSVRAKAAIVAEDERETTGRRALLNLGHTFGHALEAEAGFSDALLHGEAIAIGMTLAFRFSAERGLCASEEADRVAAHLQAAGLSTEIGSGATADRLVEQMAQDKKRKGNRITFILARGIGAAFVDNSVELEDVRAFLARQISR